MWNGKCNPGKEQAYPTSLETNLNMRNGQTNDISSLRSISSEDVSTAEFTNNCCNSDATNPAIKRGRQFQLLQVSTINHNL